MSKCFFSLLELLKGGGVGDEGLASKSNSKSTCNNIKRNVLYDQTSLLIVNAKQGLLLVLSSLEIIFVLNSTSCEIVVFSASFLCADMFGSIEVYFYVEPS